MSIGHFQTNFSRGQLSARVETRIDTQSYANGAKTISNLLVFLQGGARTRPGSLVRKRLENAGVPLAATGARVEPWHIDRDEAYVMVFTAARLDIYRLTTADVTLSQSFTTQPWTATTMAFMTVKTEGSLAVVTDQSFAPQLITRTGLDTFTIGALPFEQRVDGDEIWQPYHKYADFDMTLALSGVTDAWQVGTGRTLTASAALFDADHVGKHFLMRDGQIKITALTSSTVATAEVIREIRAILDPNPFATHNGTKTITCDWVGHGLTAGDTVNFANAGDSGIGVEGVDIDGDRTVDEVISEDQFTFTAAAAGVATDAGDFGGSQVWARTAGATRVWQEPAFSDYRGYPQACEFHEGRLVLGGPPQADSGRWFSRASNFFNFNLGDGSPADAIKAVGTTGGGIRHIVSGDDLEIFSDKRETYMPSGLDEPLTQGNVRDKKQTKYGAAYTPPLRFDGSTLFVDAVGQHVREFLYDSADNETYTASPVTALAHEVINAPTHATIFDGAAEDATPYAIYTNTDGTAAFFHSARKEQIGGWTTQSTAGTWLSFAGVGERLFACVTRGGEMFLEEWDFAYIARADGCEKLTAAATTSWTATHVHLKSATVDLFDAAGAYLEQVTTDASGNFTTTNAQTTVYVGLPASWTLETLTPALAMRDGPILGARALLTEIIVFLIATTKIKVNNTTKSWAAAFTGPKQFRGRGWSRNPTIPCSGTIADKATIPGIRAEVF